MPSVFTHEFDTPRYKGKTQFKTGLFINGDFVDGANNTYIEYVQNSLYTQPFSSCEQRRQPW